MKKLIAAVLALVMIFGAMPIIDSDFSIPVNALTEGDFEYTVTDGKATITGCTSPTGDLIIPSTLGGYPVTGIDKWVFFNKNSLTSVYIPASVASIGRYAFYFCPSLTTVTFEEGSQLTNLDNWVFASCASLASFNIPASVTSVSIFSLFENTAMTSITVDAANEHYSSDENGVLFNKDKTVLLIYPAGKTETTYQIPANVTGLGNYAFAYCKYLTTVTFAEGCQLTSINDYAFNNCKTLTSINIPACVTSIGNSAFEMCTGLNVLTFEAGSQLTSVGDYAFRNCIALANINLPAGLTGIGDEAFYYTAYYKDAANWNNDVLYIGNYLLHANDTLSGTYSILDGTRIIADNAFENCTSLEVVEIPSSVEVIGHSAFENCASLTNIVIPEGVRRIGAHVFSGSLITEIHLPASVTMLDEHSFDIDSLTGITVENANEHYSSDEYGVLFNKDKTVLIKYPVGNTRTEYQIPAGVTIIGSWAFGFCLHLTSVNIPSSVTVIRDYAFALCEPLMSVTIAEGSQLTSIGDWAFENCPALTEFNLPASVTSLGETAFYYCVALATFTFEAGSQLASIANGAFLSCESLISVNLPASVTSIGDQVFSYCTSLTSITVDAANGFYSNDENGVLFNKDKTVLVQYPIGNTRATYQVPASVTNIAMYAFRGCVNLTGVTVLPGVTSIGTRAFYKCTNLTMCGFAGSYAETYANANNIPFSALSESLMPVEGSGCVINRDNGTIYGLAPGIASLEGYALAAPGYDIAYVPTACGFGTGTVVNVMLGSEISESFIIIIFGDVNGDGNIDAMDATCIMDYENFMLDWDPAADAAVLSAADLNGDGNIDSGDAAFVVDFENYFADIDQTTGQAYPLYD
ncbi:MAG: leucine-rich repeat protein [Acutalibacteraceae bacterium]|jgi:hypothetical protein